MQLGGSASGAFGGWFGTLSNHSLHFFTNKCFNSRVMRRKTTDSITIFTGRITLFLHQFRFCFTVNPWLPTEIVVCLGVGFGFGNTE